MGKQTASIMPHMPLCSRVPQHSPTTLQRASGDMYQLEECYQGEAPKKASEILRMMEAEDIMRSNRGSLHTAVVLPGFSQDSDHWGHSPIKGHGPPPPPEGNAIGDVEMLGNTHSELNIRTAAKSEEACRKYLELALDPNARDTANMGYAMLHYAAKWDRVDVAKLLLFNGANPNLKNWDGETAAVLARKRGNYAMTRAIEEFSKEAKEQLAYDLNQHALRQRLEEQRAREREQQGDTQFEFAPQEGMGGVRKGRGSVSGESTSVDFSSDNDEMAQVMELTERLGLSLSELQSIRAGFNEWDGTDCGSISQEDIERVMVSAGLDLGDGGAEVFCGLADANGRIQFNAFVEAAAARLSKQAPRPATDEASEQNKDKVQRN